MADKKARDDEAEKRFIEREAALIDERRYVDLQQHPDYGRTGKRINAAERDKRR